MSYRAKTDDDHLELRAMSQIKQKPSTISGPAGSASSPRNKMISYASTLSELHHIPTALMVSPSGERITYALEPMGLDTIPDLKDTNPFTSNSQNKVYDSESGDDFLQKLPSRKQKLWQHNQMRRRLLAKSRRNCDRIMLKQETYTARKHPKCVSVQTEASVSLPENIGDGGDVFRSASSMKLLPTTKMELEAQQNLVSVLFLPENLRKCLSFLLMIILIFWLLSIVLDIEIPAEFFRIIFNYIVSFNFGFGCREEPKTFVQTFWDYLKYIFA